MNGGSSLLVAMSWVEHVMTGSLATSLSILAVGAVGLAMMVGRLPAWRAVRTILGMALIFGAGTIANGLTDQANDVQSDMASPEQTSLPVIIEQPAAIRYDPYAGASVPQSRASSDILAPVQ